MSLPQDWFAGFAATTEQGEVTVSKGIDVESLPVPAITFQVESAYEAPVGVVVTEDLPAEVPASNVCFAADHDGDRWTAYDGRLAWSRKLAPGESVTTCYGFWVTDPSDVFRLLDAPTVHVAPVRRNRYFNPLADDASQPTADWRAPEVGSVRKHTVADAVAATDRETREQLVEAIEDRLVGTAATDSGLSPDRFDRPTWQAGATALAPPTDVETDMLVAEPDAPATTGTRYHVRVATEGTRHGGGAVAIMQELMNAFDVVDRQVRSADRDSDVVDAVLGTDQDPELVLSALADRPQVTGVVLVELDDLPGDDAEDDAPDDRATFEEVRAEVEEVEDIEAEIAAIEAELAELSIPGIDPDAEPAIEELIADDGASGTAQARLEPPAGVDDLREQVEGLADHIEGMTAQDLAASQARPLSNAREDVERLREHVAALERNQDARR